MTLRERQYEFAKRVAYLILQAYNMGYTVSLGDAYRDRRVFGDVGESKGYGHPKSKHKQRLAIDLNLFKDGEYLTKTSDHKQLGEWWESQGGVWGGRFDDGNHYEAPKGEWISGGYK